MAPAEMVFLDEPFSGLDAAAKEACIAYINQKTAGRTLVVFLHQEEPGLSADQTLHLEQL